MFLIFSFSLVFLSRAEYFFSRTFLSRGIRGMRGIFTRAIACVSSVTGSIRQSWPTGVSVANALRVFRAFRVK